jgi:NAD(P)-dependent dehydrogenase (short-subunit alcohol dehydrogenase family)
LAAWHQRPIDRLKPEGCRVAISQRHARNHCDWRRLDCDGSAIRTEVLTCAAKLAARGFTDSLRSAPQHQGSAIRVTMVHLPAVNTPQFDWVRNRLPVRTQPMPPIHQPETWPVGIAVTAVAASRAGNCGGLRTAFINGPPVFWHPKPMAGPPAHADSEFITQYHHEHLDDLRWALGEPAKAEQDLEPPCPSTSS